MNFHKGIIIYLYTIYDQHYQFHSEYEKKNIYNNESGIL